MIISYIVMLIAAFVASIAGFGFALIASPLLLLFLDPLTALSYVVFLGAIIYLPVLWQSRHHLKVRKVMPVIAGCAFGLPLGTYILSRVSSDTLKLIIAVLVIVFASLLTLGFFRKIKREGLGSVIIGFVGGTLMPSTSLGGPPLALFLLNQGWEKENFRATMAIYFVFCGTASSIALGLSGVLTSDRLLASLSFLPVLAAGIYLGIRIFPHINARLFRLIAIGIILVAGLIIVATSLSSLLRA